jgi:hypothetical protein
LIFFAFSFAFHLSNISCFSSTVILLFLPPGLHWRFIALPLLFSASLPLTHVTRR